MTKDRDLYLVDMKRLEYIQSEPLRVYWFAGTKSDQVKQIGNAVPVNTARALCESILKLA